VSNKADAIKIASDFICAANLSATVNVSRELRRHRLANGKESGEDVLQITTTLYHAWNALEEVRSRFTNGHSISARSHSPSSLVDKRSTSATPPFRNDEVEPILPAVSSTDSDITFGPGYQPMDTTSSGSEVAKKNNKVQARRLKKARQKEARWIKDFGTIDEDSLVERFPCPLCPGLQRRYLRSTLLCHLIDRHHTELVSKSLAALKTAQSERKLCKPGKGLPRLLGVLSKAPRLRPFAMNLDRDQLICSACSRLFATRPALTTHKRGCAASKKRFSNAVDGAKSILLARKRIRTAALINLGTSESTSSSVAATQPIVRIPSISPPKNANSATEEVDPAPSA
ncbi:hypothetical protein FIBSPDRAFT_906066, partial [Athelia psychrophila]